MRVIAGPEKKARVFSELERKITAYHEMGHAVVGHFLEHTDPVHKISIVRRGQALGLTVSLPTEDRFLTSRSALMDQLAMVLGGRAAEELVYGTRTTGAENDIEQATNLARNMVTRWGMSDAIGMVQLAPPQNQFLGTSGFGGDKPFSEQTAARIDAEVHRIIHACHEDAKRLLNEHRSSLEGLVRALLQKETLSEQEILDATGLPPAPELQSRPLHDLVQQTP
jgi:cell division protease FtsH